MESCGVTINIFADDTKSTCILLRGPIRCVKTLQLALDLPVKWAELWLLEIAINKCITLKID